MRDLSMYFFPPPNKAFEARVLSMRLLWHRFFDPCPLLEKELADEHQVFFEKAVRTLASHGHLFDWRLHLELADILLEEERSITREILYELLAASAVNWCLQDWSNYAGIALVHKSLPKECVIAEKPKRAFDAPDCFVISVGTKLAKGYACRQLVQKDFENEQFEF